jgi:hypothetical protein
MAMLDITSAGAMLLVLIVDRTTTWPALVFVSYLQAYPDICRLVPQHDEVVVRPVMKRALHSALVRTWRAAVGAPGLFPHNCAGG